MIKSKVEAIKMKCADSPIGIFWNCRICSMKSSVTLASEMSLMKTGAIHNDPYCFFRLEKELFREDGRGIFAKKDLKPGAQPAAPALGRLARIFAGGRGKRE